MPGQIEEWCAADSPTRVSAVAVTRSGRAAKSHAPATTESTVRLAKADVVPTDANLREHYASFAELEAACEEFATKVNDRKHRESARIPADALIDEHARLHVLPLAPHTMALGATRSVGTDQTVRFGSVRYSTPPGLVGAEAWVRAAGNELVIVADLDALPLVPDVGMVRLPSAGHRNVEQLPRCGVGVDEHVRGIDRRSLCTLHGGAVAELHVLGHVPGRQHEGAGV